MKTKHILVIHSTHDASAACSCGFAYSFTGETTENEIRRIHDKYTNSAIKKIINKK